MRRIDELHLELPFAGSRMLRDLLHTEGIEVGRRHVATLMKRMGVEALYRRPNTTKPAPGHKIYPYLLRKLAVRWPNHVWAMDITYIPMARGFVYLTAVVDWFSRRVLAWRVSITLEVAFCLDALTEALTLHGRPEIFNTDQGSNSPAEALPTCCWQTASPSAWTARAPGATMFSSSGSGGQVKYEEVYLRAYDTGADARASISRYLNFYNTRRPHSSLGRQTPDQAYFTGFPHNAAA